MRYAFLVSILLFAAGCGLVEANPATGTTPLEDGVAKVATELQNDPTPAGFLKALIGGGVVLATAYGAKKLYDKRTKS